jgi:outer membrane protein W
MNNSPVRTLYLALISIFLLALLPSAAFCYNHDASFSELSDSVPKSIVSKPPAKWHVTVHPSLGLTVGTSNYESEKSTNLQWLGTINSHMDYIGRKLDFSSTLFAQYGKSKKSGEEAEKIKDAFILSLTPSIPLIRKPAIRLFLETTAETNLGKGTLQNNPTGFLDPLFLYQTLFVGQKHYSFQKEDKFKWELTYGLGYSFQQTFNKKFQLQSNLTGNRQGFESGFNGVLEFNMDYAISKSVQLTLSSKAMALSRESILKNFDSARKSILLNAGLFFSKIGLEYNFHYVKDLNLSSLAMSDQSLMLTLRF